MSLSITVFVKEISDDIIPQLMTELNKLDMDCEVHPDFSFATQSGFLPFKLKLRNSKFTNLANTDILSGFELYIDDFNFHTEKTKMQPKKGLVQKLFSKRTTDIPLYSTEIDNKLMDCKKSLSFIWGSGDTFELRFATLASAIISRLANGLCYYEADSIWYDNNTILENALKEIKDYESSLGVQDVEFHKFESWS